GLKAVEQRLRTSGTDGGDGILAGGLSGARRPGDPGNVFEIDLGQAAGRGQARSIAAQRNGDVLVSRARRSALSIELWIVLVGLHQGLFKCFGASRAAEQHKRCDPNTCSNRKKLLTPAP